MLGSKKPHMEYLWEPTVMALKSVIKGIISWYTTSGIGVISSHWYLLDRGHNCHKNNKITIFRSRFTIFP